MLNVNDKAGPYIKWVARPTGMAVSLKCILWLKLTWNPYTSIHENIVFLSYFNSIVSIYMKLARNLLADFHVTYFKIDYYL